MPDDERPELVPRLDGSTLQRLLAAHLGQHAQGLQTRSADVAELAGLHRLQLAAMNLELYERARAVTRRGQAGS